MPKSDQICECGHIEFIHVPQGCMIHGCPCVKFVKREVPSDRGQE